MSVMSLQNWPWRLEPVLFLWICGGEKMSVCECDVTTELALETGACVVSGKTIFIFHLKFGRVGVNIP